MRQPGPRVFSKLLRCCPRTWPARAPVQCNANWTFSSHFALRSSHPALHTCSSHSTLHLISPHLISSELFSSHFMSSHNMSAQFFLTIFFSSEHSSTFLISPKLVSTHLRSSARQNAWDTDASTQKSLYKILCTTKLAQSTSQYYFVLQSLHRVLPSSTLLLEDLKKTPFTSSHLFLTHLSSSVCQKILVTDRISCAQTLYIVYPGWVKLVVYCTTRP